MSQHDGPPAVRQNVNEHIRMAYEIARDVWFHYCHTGCEIMTQPNMMRELHFSDTLENVLKLGNGQNPVGRTFTFEVIEKGYRYFYHGVPAVVDGDTVTWYAPEPWHVEPVIVIEK